MTYKTFESVLLVRQSSSMSSSSSKILSKESLKTLMSVSNSDKLSVVQERRDEDVSEILEMANVHVSRCLQLSVLPFTVLKQYM